MTIEKFLIFWNLNNTLIIEVLIAIILGIILLSGYLSFFGKNQSADGLLDGSGVSSDELQNLIKKLVENSGQLSAAHTDSKNNNGSKENSTETQNHSMALDIELVQLKKNLQEREAELSQVKEQLTEAQNSLQKLSSDSQSQDTASPTEPPQKVDSPSTAAQLAEDKEKIKELEARLAEYDIISEDIADISRYKDENQRLKNEIENLKAQIPSTTIKASSESPQTDTEAPTPDVSSEININDDLMKEFSEAVNNQKREQEEAQLAKKNDELNNGKESA